MSTSAVTSFGAHPVEAVAKDGAAAQEEHLKTTDEMDEQPASLVAESKLAGYDLWKSMNEPKYVVAPMVDQSELAWRVLSRMYGANLCYTPMFHAALFSSQPKYQHEMFDLSPDSIEGVAPYDRPLVVQFCANDKDQWLESASKVQGRCDAVDLNLGCPQGIARRGRYGAFLMEEWDLIRSMISHLHKNLAIPVTAKIRRFPTLSKTLEYASHVYSSGAQILTIHGRTREMKGQLTGFASWDMIRSVVNLVQPRVPVIANGGVPGVDEVEPCLEETGASAVMSAEGNLYNPMMFNPSNHDQARTYVSQLPTAMRDAIEACDAELEGGTYDRSVPYAYAPAPYLARQYLEIVRTLPGGTETSTSAIKAHMYKLFRPVWAAGRHLEMRETLGRSGARGLEYRDKVDDYVRWLDTFRDLIKSDIANGLLPANSYRPLTLSDVSTDFAGQIPYSHCQPYLRVTKPENGKEESELKKVDDEAKRKREHDEEPVLEDAKRSKPSPPSPAQPSTSADVASSTTTPAPPPLCANHSSRSAPTFPVPIPTPSLSSSPTDADEPKPVPEPCSNAASAKCSNNACKACCHFLRTRYPSPDTPTTDPSSDPSVTGSASTSSPFACEFHETKEEKDRQRNLEIKEVKRKKKERGAQRAKENQQRDHDEKERRKREREEAHKAKGREAR